MKLPKHLRMEQDENTLIITHDLVPDTQITIDLTKLEDTVLWLPGKTQWEKRVSSAYCLQLMRGIVLTYLDRYEQG